MTKVEQETCRLDWFAVASVVVLAFAAVLRFRGLDTSMYEDEVWVAQLIRDGDWHPHSYSTPPLFYALERGWAMIAGATPDRLRQPPAFFGVVLAAIPLTANRNRATRFVWSLFLAFSSPILFYSGRIKQYTLEASFAALLIVLVLRALDSKKKTAWLAFFAVALISVTTLYSLVFLIFAIALVTIPRAPRLALPFGGVFAAFGAAYFLYLAPGQESTKLHGDMQAFFTEHGRWITSPASFFTNSMHFSGELMNLVHGWWIAAALAAILCIFRREDRPIAVVTMLMVAAVAAASVLRIYPYGEVRLMIFSFPAVSFVVAAGLETATSRTPLLARSLVTLFFFSYLWNGVVRDIYNATYMHIYDLRPLYAAVAVNRQPAETIYAVQWIETPMRYYHPELGRTLTRWNDAKIHGTGWYVDFRPIPHSDRALKIANAWASHLTLP